MSACATGGIILTLPPKMMQSVPLGVSSLQCSRLAYGCWRLAGTWNPREVRPGDESRGRLAVITAYEAGYTLFDNADIYCHGRAESIFGAALRQVPGMRNEIIVATKCGIRFAGEPAPTDPGRYDFSEDYIVQCCEDSLRRMGIETIDLFQLHRPDYLADPEEVASAFSKLRESGKVRHFGVSNFRPSQVTTLQVFCPMPLLVNQVEISLGKLDAFTNGTLDQCLIERLTPLAWSPLAKGMLGDGAKNLSADQQAAYSADRITPVLEIIAKAHGVSPAVVALAWLLKHPAKIVPIVGSINPDRIRDAVKAASLVLSREEWYRLLVAARGEPVP